MQLSGHVALCFTSNTYKYKQLILVSKSERCAISQLSIKELYEGNSKRGFPHVLALVHGDQGGKDIYDACALSESFIRNKRWEWKNPATNELIKRIDFFVINDIEDDYLLLEKIKIKNKNAQAYEDLWFCNNLSFATDNDNPYAFHSIFAVIRHFIKLKDNAQEVKWRYRCYQSIVNHFGKGVGLLLLGYIIKSRGQLLENLLFIDFKYTCFDDLFVGSKLDELISERKQNLFESQSLKENYDKVRGLVYSILQEKSHLSGAKFAEFLFQILENHGFTHKDLEVFASNRDFQIAHLAQAALCTVQESYIKNYMENLIAECPKWKLGQALLLNQNLEKARGTEVTALLDSLVELSLDTKDILVLQLLVNRFIDFSAKSNMWVSVENICMKILLISRFREDISKLYVNTIKDAEGENSLFILKRNFDLFQTYSSLADLSNLQREIGIQKIDKELYFEGVEKGLQVFENTQKHKKLMYPLGKDLVAEITPFKASKEQEAKGLEILKVEAMSFPNNLMLQIILGEYLIRKGTAIEARDAILRIDVLKVKFGKELSLHMSSVRGALRFAEKREDLLIVEEMIRECETIGASPILFLLKALWQSHPLRRDTVSEWYILASFNFKKAFENAESHHVKFILDNLSRYDKLVEEDQIKCRSVILELLGIT